MNRPHPLKYPTIRAARRIRAYTLARWQNLRLVIRPVASDSLRAFGIVSFVFCTLALPYQFYAHRWWMHDTQFEQNVAALRDRMHHASAQYAQAQVQHVAYRADFWSNK